MSRKTAAILLSRQPLRPCGKTAWVRQSVEAVRWLKRKKLALLSSIGMQTWELLTSLATLEDLKQTLFVPIVRDNEFEELKESAILQFDLNPHLVDFVPVLGRKKNTTKEELWLKRDAAIIDAAEVLFPVSVREGGHMDSQLQLLGQRGKCVEDQFRVEYEKRIEPLAYNIRIDQLSPKLSQIANQYLIHWTRASNSAWPTERLIDYYKAIIAFENYPRSAFNTLMNIISTKKIVASPKNMPRDIPTVSFSGLSPIDVVPLMRWRSRFSQMSFEPYGIGIEKAYAQSGGVRQVRYYDRKRDHTADSEPWLWQSIGKLGDWSAEQEFRCKDDFDFSDTPTHRLLAFCHTKKEAQIIEESTGIRAVSFLSDDII